jgi:hypothetical protein
MEVANLQNQIAFPETLNLLEPSSVFFFFFVTLKPRVE